MGQNTTLRLDYTDPENGVVKTETLFMQKMTAGLVKKVLPYVNNLVDWREKLLEKTLKSEVKDDKKSFNDTLLDSLKTRRINTGNLTEEEFSEYLNLLALAVVQIVDVNKGKVHDVVKENIQLTREQDSTAETLDFWEGQEIPNLMEIIETFRKKSGATRA